MELLTRHAVDHFDATVLYILTNDWLATIKKRGVPLDDTGVFSNTEDSGSRGGIRYIWMETASDINIKVQTRFPAGLTHVEAYVVWDILQNITCIMEQQAFALFS